MDVLLSLPIVSYFLAPAVTSWSTSLNLLFFYMVWSTLVLSHPPLRIELVGVLGLRLLLWLLPSLLFLLFDTLVPSIADSIKYRGARGLPPRDARRLARLLGLALLNLVLATLAEAGVALGHAALGRGPVFQTSTTLPLPWQMIKHVLLLMASRETLTYYIHRYALPQPGGRSRIPGAGAVGRWHNRSYAHSRRDPPFSLLVLADHPVPCLLHRFVPVYLPALALRPHLLTYLLFVALVTAEETVAMSGYSAVPGIVVGGIARRTTLHYCSGGRGNFGAWGFLDWVHGTSLGKDVMEDVKDEAEKHHVKEKGQEAVDGGLSVVQKGIEGMKNGRRTRRSKKASP